MELAHPRDSLVLPNPFMFAIAQDSLYFGGFQDAIYASGFDGVLMRRIGRAGKGPGEFDQLSDLVYNGTYFVVGEASRIQVLSQDFEYIASLPPQKSELLPGTGLVATENYIYTSCRRDSEYRVCPRSAEPPLQEEDPFLQSIGITSPPMMGLPSVSRPMARVLWSPLWDCPTCSSSMIHMSTFTRSDWQVLRLPLMPGIIP